MRGFISIILLMFGLAGLPASLPAQAAVTAIYGGSLACNPALPACGSSAAIPPLTTVTTLCSGSSLCPIQFAIDPTNTTRFYGGNGDCVRSLDTGQTWQACLSSVVGGSVGISGNGSIIRVESGPGACVIRRSQDGTATWQIVYNALPRCPGGRIQCIVNTCVIPAGINTTSTNILFTTNNGDGWNEGCTGCPFIDNEWPQRIFYDGTSGVVTTGLGSNQTLYTVTGSSGWADSPTTSARTGCYGSFSGRFGLVSGCDGAGFLELVDVVSNNIIVPTVPNYYSLGPARPVLAQLSGNVYLYARNSLGTCHFWVSIAGSVFTEMICSNTSTSSSHGFVPLGANLYVSNGQSGVNAVLMVLTP